MSAQLQKPDQYWMPNMTMSEKLSDKLWRTLQDEKDAGMSQNPYTNTLFSLQKYIYCDPRIVEIFHRKMNYKELSEKKNAKNKLKQFEQLDDETREKVDVMPYVYRHCMMQLKTDLMSQLLAQVYFCGDVSYDESADLITINNLTTLFNEVIKSSHKLMILTTAPTIRTIDEDKSMLSGIDEVFEVGQISKHHLLHCYKESTEAELKAMPILSTQDIKILLR